MIYTNIRHIILLALLCFVSPYAANAELSGLRGSALPIPNGMENRIMFWVDIFARYGEDQSVIHHRDYPEIVYSVIDFTELKKQHDYRPFRKLREKMIDQEKERVRVALKQLGSGGSADTQLKRRIVQIYTPTIGAKRSSYRKAADIELIRSQTGIMERFRFGVQRSFRYIDVMEDIFRDQGLPPELTRLPLIESSFNYEARSSVGAAGIWQFMPATAKSYMRVDNYIDERLDPIIATRSAAKYLANAYRNLQTWPLAVTSYNHGVSGMMRAVKQVGTRDFPKVVQRYDSRTFGFASKNFYVELLAAVEVQKNWRKYFPDLNPEAPIAFDEVKLKSSVSFPKLVKASGVAHEELQRLNFGFKDPIIKGRVNVPAGYVLKTPKNLGNSLLAKLGSGQVLTLASSSPTHKEKPGSEHWHGQYRVKKGDSLGKIAVSLGVTQTELLRENNLRDANLIRQGQLLRVPSAKVRVAKSQKKKRKVKTTRYTVRSGDTIGKIAQNFSLSSGELMRVNGINDPRKLKEGQVLTINQGNTRQYAAVGGGVYTVQKGDTLYGISRELKIPVNKLREINRGLKDVIRPGQTINY